MKILVFSDSHGTTANMKKAIDEHLKYGAIDRIFYLGDGIQNIISLSEEYTAIQFDYVLGNCDSAAYHAHIPYEKIVAVERVKFILTHGHNHDIKSDYTYAANYAIAKNADVLLFGHTHRAEDITIEGTRGGHVRMINPGSCGNTYLASYATIYVEEREIICGFGNFK